MSSSCPPQLQLTLQPNTTSFKRSFQQFGFDFPSPVEGSDGSQNDGNDRNKRARSETSFSDSTDSSQSSMVASASSSSLSPPGTGSIRTAGLSSDTSFGPPRLPTPDIEDIQMPDYPNDERSSDLSFSSQNEARYRLSLGSFDSLDEDDAVQRSRPSSPGVARLSTPPPVLPPLAISEGPPRLSIPSTTVSFMETRPASPLTEGFFGGESPSRATMQSSPAEDSDLIQGFRARLSGALERLVPQSPLVPGLELDDRDEQVPTLNNNLLQESTPLEVLPAPPTLPPIPSVSTTAEHINIDTLFGEGPADSLSSPAASSTSHSSISPSLDAHPLPSPILRDLRTWMHGQERQMSAGFTNSASRHWQPHSYDPTSPPASSNTGPSSPRQRQDEEVTRVPGNSDRPHIRPVPELSTHSPNTPHETDLWERRSFELGNPSHDDPTYSDNSSRQSITGISSSPDLSWMDHPPRLQFAFRRRSRLGSTISLVTENSLEAGRIADHDHIVRDFHAGRGPRMDDIDMDVPRNDSLESSRDDILSRLDLGRFRAPYVHLPPFPTSSLDVAPEAREEEEYDHERDAGRGTVSPMWYYATSGPGNYQGGERRGQPIRSHAENPDTEPSLHNSFTFSQYSPPQRPSSPMRPSPPVAVLPPTSSFARVPQNHRAPVGDAYNRRPHINLTRHLALNQRREPPPLLPQPDLGHAFVTEGQDRDVEMGGTPHAPGQPRGEYYPHSESTSPSTISYLQPRTYREENFRPYFWDSPPDFRQPPTLLGDSPPTPVSRLQRQVHIVPDPLDIPGRPRPQPADTRRVLRFALPQPEEGGRFPNSSPTVRLPERMPPIVPSVNTDDRTENQGFSSIQSSHRTSEPRYPSGPAIVDRRRDTLPAYSPTTLDPAAFAPGPFRNTIHHSFFPRMNRPTPPTIPPLPFQEPPPNSHFQNNNSVPVPSPEETFLPRGPFSRDEPGEFNYSVRMRRPPQNTEQRPPRPPFAPPRVFTVNRNNDDDNTTGNRRRMPLHNSTQEGRLEASRLAELLSLDPSNSPSAYGTHPLPPRTDSTRLSAERQQFINFLHRHSEGERRRGSGDGTHTEGPQANDARPPNNLPPRRFGAVDLEHWRTRARGRFRITPEFLTAARIRPGSMGDFIHDDDFDDSYENLVNLAVTIGDVKPKSTPADVLEKLDKGVYKEWKTVDGDKRCPICLDDYTDHDTLLKLNNCDHWFHQDCLKQWLHTANTCPVCRNTVHNSEPLPTSPRRPPGRRFGFWRGGPPPPPGGGAGEEGSSNRPRSNGNAGGSNRWTSPLRRRFD